MQRVCGTGDVAGRVGMVFMKEFYHLHEEYLARLKK